MTIQQAKLEYLMLVNRNATNNRANVDDARFILSFNDIQDKYIQWVLEKRNDDDIRYLQPILVSELSLTPTTSTTLHRKFAIPSNYFDFANLHVTASKDCCGKQTLLPYEVKSEDTEELLFDENHKPSFEFRETFYYISGGQICVFYTDFSIDKVLLTYYRYPVKVDIAGYTHFETGLASANINPEFDDKVVRRILLGMSRAFSANTEDAQGVQMDKDRLFTII